eukprot:scaffold59450_cov57-Phaeocystis_antarctica.AAC.1
MGKAGSGECEGLSEARGRAWTTHIVDVRGVLKAHLANSRSTSGLPRLDPFSLYVGGIGKRRGE